MNETAAIALTTFLATISPLNVAAVFATLTANTSSSYKRTMATRGALIAAAILIVFAMIGESLLTSLGISLAALRTSGGILLLLIGIEMVFVRTSGGTSTTEVEEQEAAGKQDISVFPLATPMMAGPGTMGAAILLMANTQGELALQAIVIGSLVTVIFVSFIALMLASQIQKILGVTGMQVISRVMGVLLSALAVQFIFDGIKQSGLLGG